jgi:hypothetical protein
VLRARSTCPKLAASEADVLTSLVGASCANGTNGTNGTDGNTGSNGADAVCNFALVDVNGGLSSTRVHGIATSSTLSTSTGT